MANIDYSYGNWLFNIQLVMRDLIVLIIIPILIGWCGGYLMDISFVLGLAFILVGWFVVFIIYLLNKRGKDDKQIK